MSIIFPAPHQCVASTVSSFLGETTALPDKIESTLTQEKVSLEQVPDCVSDAAAVFAEPLAAACRILEQGLVPPGADAAVLGDGKLGLLIAEVLARRGTTATGEVMFYCFPCFLFVYHLLPLLLSAFFGHFPG